MKIDASIAEMVEFAIQHPYKTGEEIKRYQRQLNEEVAVTLFVKNDETGQVSLTSKRGVTDEEKKRVLLTLAPLSCRVENTERRNDYLITRFSFSDPRTKPPLFNSELDDYLCGYEAKSVKPVVPKERRQPDAPQEHHRPVFYAPSRSVGLPRPKPKEPKLYWDELPEDRCHICHRELTDPTSIQVSIGPICRKKIEAAEEQESAMWDDISRERLEQIWTHYNIYARRYRDR